LLPVLLTSDSGDATLAFNVMTVLLSAGRLTFIAFLAYVFRLRADSPYLQIGEEQADTLTLDTSLSSAPVEPMRVRFE